MSKVIVVLGFGPGTATSVAEKFGEGGFSVALVARNDERVAAGVSALRARGIAASGFRADAADPTSIRTALKSIRSQMGPITILHWNAYGAEAGDLLTADRAALQRDLDVSIFGLLAATDEVRADLRETNEGAILVSTGGLGDVSPQVDQAAAALHMEGLALASAAKHKLVGLLAQSLKPEGIYVGEVMTFSTIQGTPGEVPANSVSPSVIADKFWGLYQSRSETRATVR
ncbi:MAG TPA: SDR family NAD(P)-dependent oxidoreductase [Candidatus Cybelea sp.]|jgi:NAD(P)-dependent dehydrogenase (short-subunit alcohol dehydrogenase family)